MVLLRQSVVHADTLEAFSDLLKMLTFILLTLMEMIRSTVVAWITSILHAKVSFTVVQYVWTFVRAFSEVVIASHTSTHLKWISLVPRIRSAASIRSSFKTILWGRLAAIYDFSESIDEENTYLLRPELSHGNVLISGQFTLRPAAT